MLKYLKLIPGILGSHVRNLPDLVSEGHGNILYRVIYAENTQLIGVFRVLFIPMLPGQNLRRYLTKQITFRDYCENLRNPEIPAYIVTGNEFYKFKYGETKIPVNQYNILTTLRADNGSIKSESDSLRINFYGIELKTLGDLCFWRNLPAPDHIRSEEDRKSTRLKSSHIQQSRMPSSA